MNKPSCQTIGASPQDILARIDEWMRSANGQQYDCVRYYTPPMKACVGCVIREARSEIQGMRRMLEASHLADCPDKTRGTDHHWLCDREDGAWCGVCFSRKGCGKGKHGEGCPTQVFASQSDEDKSRG